MLVSGLDDSFGQPSRLVRKKDFAQVFQNPVRVSDDCFTVLARPNAVGRARLGLGISRRASPRAVDRNRVKRLVRESFRQQHFLSEVDVVVLARPGAGRFPNARLNASLERLWVQLDKRVRARQDRQA